ncbi:amino acid adenylation domain-containing protein [Staphylococcus xylosus]|nr:amino acid adenylation domain-containing protein [Staphylococcus xylosus]
MVRLHANDVALVFKNESLTYDVLNQRVNQVAHYLRSLDIQPNEHVCILAERSIEMVIAILGTIKAGAAYVAIDPQAPQSRVKYIVDDAKSRIILLHNVAYNQPGPTKNISEIVCSNTSNPTIINHLDDTVNVIYTSGTTGKPKGTLIRNRSIERLVINSKYVPLNSDTVILLSGTIAFDATTFEIFGALLNGGTLVITQQSTLLDPNELEKAIINHGVNTMWLTSSLFNQVVSEKIEALESLKYLLIGGEALSTKWVNLLNSREKHPQIINGYGPTESTTFTTTFVIRDLYESHIPIGQPINQTQVYVMQGEQQCGFGVPGELYIAGDGLAKGYLNQPEQTQNKFIDNPFGEGKLYKSGDLVRLRPDGNLDYIGRKDKQVKIRGFRIELTEIEKLLEKIDGINKAVVVVKTRYKDKQIVAYYEGVNVMSHSILHQHLAEELPQYMIPNFFKKLKKYQLR